MNYNSIENTLKLEYHIRFSRKVMIQYITMLFMYEHSQNLFHIMPCHDGSHEK